MHAVKFLVAVVLFLTATMVQAAGVRAINVPADAHGPRLHGAMWYPCAEPAGDIDLGGIVLPGVKDCPLSGGNLPLVVISHGAGGSFIDFHDLAETLADAGFVVAAINHPGNTSSDMSRIGDLSSLSERPEDIKRLIDFMVGGSGASPEIDAKRIGFFGFSRGGYTGLLLSAVFRIGRAPARFASNRRFMRARKSAIKTCRWRLRCVIQGSVR
jgi:predicted dienelactone hydrolase